MRPFIGIPWRSGEWSDRVSMLERKSLTNMLKRSGLMLQPCFRPTFDGKMVERLSGTLIAREDLFYMFLRSLKNLGLTP
jgi:hypothetical protein